MEAATEPVLVPGYKHVPGNHCGSTALRNLLAFHGAPISEEMAFGLGAGACFFYVVLEGQSPSRFTNGRAARLEENFLELTGTSLRLRKEADPEQAWKLARSTVDDGRPALLLTDLYYLDHYGSSAHFPGHAIVLAGYDEKVAYLSDTAFEELQTTKLDHLAEARASDHPAYPLEGHMVDLPPGGDVGDLRGAVPAAIARAAEEMIEPSLGEYQGLPALERLAEEIGAWPELAEDWQWCARFLYQVIEKRGTGGGNFRYMYAGFLEETGHPEAAGLATEAARRWSALAAKAFKASESDEPDHQLWGRLARIADRVRDAEVALWTALAS